MYELRDHFIESVQRIDGVSVNGRTDHTNAPHVVSAVSYTHLQALQTVQMMMSSTQISRKYN